MGSDILGSSFGCIEVKNMIFYFFNIVLLVIEDNHLTFLRHVLAYQEHGWGYRHLLQNQVCLGTSSSNSRN